MSRIVIELTVRNHPGVMSHVAGLFSRRACNLEGILCGPIQGGETSRMYLLVTIDDRLPNILRQLEKLYDVLAVSPRGDCPASAFYDLDALMEASGRVAAA